MQTKKIDITEELYNVIAYLCLPPKSGDTLLYCYASNAYFALILKVNKNTISRTINNLIKSGHIKAKYSPGVRFLQITSKPFINREH